MTTYVDPNALEDAPVKKQIMSVLIGFAVVTAVIAVAINMVV